MQEAIERRTVTVSITATKLTAKVLVKASMAVLRKIQKENRKAQIPHCRQTVKNLMNHGIATSTIPLDSDTRLFERVAWKWNVDYSFHKTGPNKNTCRFLKRSRSMPLLPVFPITRSAS